MKKSLFILALLMTLGGYSQSSKFEISYVPDFGNAYGVYTDKVSFVSHNINFNYNFLSWASRFQLGPLLSFSYTKQSDGDYRDYFNSYLAIGIGAGYLINEMFSFKLEVTGAITGAGSGAIVIKPALEYNIYNNWAIVVGVANYLEDRSPGNLFALKNSSRVLAGVKYKF